MTLVISYDKVLLSSIGYWSLIIILNVGAVFNTWNFFTSGIMNDDFICGSSFGFIDMITQKPNCQFENTMIHPFIPMFLNIPIALLIDFFVITDLGLIRFIEKQSQQSEKVSNN